MMVAIESPAKVCPYVATVSNSAVMTLAVMNSKVTFSACNRHNTSHQRRLRTGGNDPSKTGHGWEEHGGELGWQLRWVPAPRAFQSLV